MSNHLSSDLLWGQRPNYDLFSLFHFFPAPSLHLVRHGSHLKGKKKQGDETKGKKLLLLLYFRKTLSVDWQWKKRWLFTELQHPVAWKNKGVLSLIVSLFFTVFFQMIKVRKIIFFHVSKARFSQFFLHWTSVSC